MTEEFKVKPGDRRDTAYFSSFAGLSRAFDTYFGERRSDEKENEALPGQRRSGGFDSFAALLKTERRYTR